MPMLQAFWKKLTTNEKFVMYGAGVVVISFLINVAALQSSPGDLFAPILITVLYYLKYSTMKISWPVPISTIVLVIAGIATVFGLLAVLPMIAVIGKLEGIAAIAYLVGAAVMAYFAFREYGAAAPKATPPAAK